MFPSASTDDKPEMLKASDTPAGAVGKLAAGNVGAACVLGRIMKDPFAGLMILMDLERALVRNSDEGRVRPLALGFRQCAGIPAYQGGS
jgi:hypothetical protein